MSRSPSMMRWRSESGAPLPDALVERSAASAEEALAVVSAGEGLLWRGDYHKGKELLAAMGRGLAARAGQPVTTTAARSTLEAFQRQRAETAERATLLGRLLIEVGADGHVDLPRAPDLRLAMDQAWGLDGQPFRVALRDVLGAIGALEWRKNGVPLTVLGRSFRVHPWYGVFAPVRGEYVGLVAEAARSARPVELGMDLGCGTGVLAAVLVGEGLARRVIATDCDPRAAGCARENLARLGMGGLAEPGARGVSVVEADLFPAGRAGVIVCNPPWLPGPARTSLERAVYDPESRMLRGFLAGARDHLAPAGEAWLVISDLAERIGLRGPDELTGWIRAAGLEVVARSDRRPSHPRAADPRDPVHAARAAEITSLWRLRAG